MAEDSANKKRLGKILLKQKLVTQEELEQLLEQKQKRPDVRLGSVVLQSGKAGEADLLKALSEQHGVPGVDLGQVVIPLSNLRLIPQEIARQHLILPVVLKEGKLFLAMADPTDRRVIDEIEFVTGTRVFPYVALQDPLQSVIEDAYRSLENGEELYVGTQVTAEYLASVGLSRAASKKPPSISDLPVADFEAMVMEEEPARGLDVEVDAFGENLDTRPRAHVEAGAEGSSVEGPQKILVVDDEEDIRRLLRRVLGERGYQVLEAADGREALQSVRDHMPNVILLDAMLPGVHGFDICRRLKASKRYGKIPIVMVSAIYRGWRFAEDLKQSYGVDAFLEKPFKISDVVSAVEQSLQGLNQPETQEDDDLSREARQRLERGIEAYQQGNMEAAIEELRQGVLIDPLSFQLHYHLGLLYGRKDSIFEAIHELEAAVNLQTRHFSALKNLAVLYQRAGFKHRAVEMWERALNQAPDDATRQDIKELLVTLF